MFHITIQYTADKALAPKARLLRKWAKQTLSKQIKSADITIRIVDKNEMSILNATYRHKHAPTNVLSFPFSTSNNSTLLLGDIIICADIVNQEAQEQHKSPRAHWAHMVIHGVFHLLGFDHKTNRDAKIMESLEIKIMETLGFTNPYEGIKDE